MADAVRRLRMVDDMPTDRPDDPGPASLHGSAEPAKAATAQRKRGGKGSTPPRAPNLGGVNTLFDHFAYQYGSDVAWDCDERMPIRISHLRHTFGNDAVRMWMSSEKRRVIRKEQIVFDPSEEVGKECLNLFRGWAVEPQAGDTAPWYELLRYLCSDDEAVMDWLMCWLAHIVQRPGKKMPTAVVMHGGEGTGKNLLMETFGAIMGRHFTVVGQRELESQWNEWASGKLFVIGDEVVSRAELKHHKGVLKALITSTDVQVSAKFQDLRSERNCMHLVFFSNEVTPLLLDPSDRRYMVVWTQQRGDAGMYQRFVAWRDAGGAAALFDELLKRDLSAWEWWAPPPMTQAKEDLINLGRPSPERWWREWSGHLIYGMPCSSCSADQAYKVYLRWCRLEGERFPMAKNVFGRMVAREAHAVLKVRVANTIKGHLRMWLVAPPPEDRAFGEWAAEAVDDFAKLYDGWARDEAAQA